MTSGSQELWQDIVAVLIEAGEPLTHRRICELTHHRHTEVYPRLLQLYRRGIVDRTAALDSSGQDVLWWYIGEDIARAAVTDLDT